MVTEGCTTRLTVVTFKNGWDGKRTNEAGFQYVLEIYLTDSWKLINISFIYYFSNKVLNQKQSVCYLFTTQRNTDNIFNTQTSNIQNSVQGSIENIDTEYSSYVPGSRSSSWPLSHKHSSKVTRLSCLSLAHPSKSSKFCWD